MRAFNASGGLVARVGVIGRCYISLSMALTPHRNFEGLLGRTGRETPSAWTNLETFPFPVMRFLSTSNDLFTPSKHVLYYPHLYLLQPSGNKRCGTTWVTLILAAAHDSKRQTHVSNIGLYTNDHASLTFNVQRSTLTCSEPQQGYPRSTQCS